MLLLYQVRVRKSWHDELKTGFFYNLAKQDEKRMTIACREMDTMMRRGPLSTRWGHPRCTRTPSIASPSPSLPFPDAFPRPRPAFPAPYAR